MATLSQLASIVQNSINGGNGVINENIHINQIKDEIVMTSRRLVDEYRRQGFFSEFELNQMFQRVDCIELECKPLTQCCNLDIKTERTVLYAKIPPIVDIRYIGVIEYTKPFIITYAPNLSIIGHSRFTKNKVTAWVRGNSELIILNPPTFDFKHLSIDAMFQDPRDIYKYSCTACFTDDDVFPIPDKFADIITGKLIASYFQYKQLKPIQPNTQSDIV